MAISFSWRDAYEFIQKSPSTLSVQVIERIISLLQAAIRQEPLCPIRWRCLAEAYIARGSLASASSALLQCESLLNDQDAQESMGDLKATTAERIYVHLRLADSHLQQFEYEDAKSRYENVLRIEQDNVAALIGLGRVHLELAKERFAQHYKTIPSADCRKALFYLVKAIKLRPDLVTPPHLAADVCLTVVMKGTGQLDQLNKLSEPIFPDTNKLIVDRPALIDRSIKFLYQAIAVAQSKKWTSNSQLSTLWHDLAVAHLLKAVPTGRVTTAKTDTRLLQLAAFAALKAVKLSPSGDTPTYNTLAIILIYAKMINAASKVLTHSCQLRSALHPCEVEKCNLGALELMKLSNSSSSNGASQMSSIQKSANLFFSEGQNEDPEFAHPWLGQAYIADQLSHHETGLLYRQACETSSENQPIPAAQLGLACHVIRMASINSPYSRNVLDKSMLEFSHLQAQYYTERFPNDSIGWFLLASLMELNHEPRRAVVAARNAQRFVSSEANPRTRVCITLTCARLVATVDGDLDHARKLMSTIDSKQFEGDLLMSTRIAQHQVLLTALERDFVQSFHVALPISHHEPADEQKFGNLFDKSALLTLLGRSAYHNPQQGIKDAGWWLMKAATECGPDADLTSYWALLFLGRKMKNLKVAMGALDELLKRAHTLSPIKIRILLLAAVKWIKFRRDHLLAASISPTSQSADELERLLKELWRVISSPPSSISIESDENSKNFSPQSVQSADLRIVAHLLVALGEFGIQKKETRRRILVSILQAIHSDPGREELRNLLAGQHVSRDKKLILSDKLRDELTRLSVKLLLSQYRPHSGDK